MILDVKNGNDVNILDFFEERKENRVLTFFLNPVNTKGVMGAGVALLVKNKYPETFKKYRNWCNRTKPNAGDICWDPICQIFHCATKDHWKNPSKIEYVSTILSSISGWVDGYTATTPDENVLFISPLLGCGLGGLDEMAVYDLFEKYFGNNKYVDVVLFNK